VRARGIGPTTTAVALRQARQRNLQRVDNRPHGRKRTHTYGPTGLPRGTTTEAVPQPYRYTGAYLDPTGQYKMGARYYDPTLARFTQPDPSGQETNPYLYAAGDPVNHADPTGLLSLDPVLKAVSGANDIDTVGRIWNAAVDGDWGRAAGIGFGLAVGKSVEATCIGAAGYFGGPAGAGAAAVPCMAAGEAAGSFAEDTTVSAWS
jgi:RHS repeat-associated protein